MNEGMNAIDRGLPNTVETFHRNVSAQCRNNRAKVVFKN